nr:MAG TPA: tail protein [Caudoviricetes sp.]
MGRSKIVYAGDTLLDLTEDTVTPETLLKGKTAHNAAGELITGVYEPMNIKQYTGTLLASGWAADSHGYQAQTITITGLKASYDVDPQWDVALSGTDPDADAALLEGFALIHNYVTGANSLTAQCIGAAPTINIPVKVVVFG